jgi:hypothetical protein
MKTTYHQTISLSQIQRSRRFKKIVMLLLVLFLLLASSPRQADAATACTDYRVIDPVLDLAWRECPLDAYSGYLYRADVNGVWQFWGVYSYTADRAWKYLLYRDYVSLYLENRISYDYYVWNGQSWLFIYKTQIPW